MHDEVLFLYSKGHLFFVFHLSFEIVWVFSQLSFWLTRRMHWMDALALRRKDAFLGERPWGERVSVIHGSPIGKPYPSSVASLRSLDFSNLANWNIWVAKGRKINRDPVSSGERERNKGFHQKKSEAVSFDLLWIGWWKNQQAASVGCVAVARPTELYKVSNRFGAQA